MQAKMKTFYLSNIKQRYYSDYFSSDFVIFIIANHFVKENKIKTYVFWVKHDTIPTLPVTNLRIRIQGSDYTIVTNY